jgi:UDP-glucose 4-epimerase
MNIVITGANGYIGSVLSKKLPDANFYDIDSWDIRFDDVEDLSIDVVVHLAALVKVGESVYKPWQYYETNVTGTYNVIQAFPKAKMIFASTGAAFDPTSPYGISKVMAEEVVKQYCNEYTIFRFYNVGGGTPTNPEGLYSAVKKAEYTGEFTIFGGDYNTKDGTPVRDYVHVEDLTDAIVKSVYESAAMTDYEPLGSGQSYTVKEYLDTYLKKYGPKFVYKIGDRRPGDMEISEVPFMSRFITPKKTLKDIV